MSRDSDANDAGGKSVDGEQHIDEVMAAYRRALTLMDATPAEANRISALAQAADAEHKPSKADPAAPKPKPKPARASRDTLPLEALVIAAAAKPRSLSPLEPDRQAIMRICRDARTVAEISAVLRMPLDATRALIASMSEDGLVRVHQCDDAEAVNRERMLTGLRTLADNPGAAPRADASRPDADASGGAGTTGTAAPASGKVVVAGGPGTGKTAFLGSVSEIVPLAIDAAPDTAVDFGRITPAEDLTLCLFEAPGQHQFWFMWDELAIGAMGAVVLADTRRLAGCFGAIDYFERREIPFIVALNHFEGSRPYDPGDVRIALDLGSDLPVITCDARSRESAMATLTVLLEHCASQPLGSRDGGHRRLPPQRRPPASPAPAAQFPADVVLTNLDL